VQTKSVSSTVNMVITNSIAGNSCIPRNCNALRKEAERLQERMPGLSIDTIMMLLLVQEMIGPYLEQQEAFRFFMNEIAAESRVFSVGDFRKNPYIKNIDFANRMCGDFELR